MLFMGKTKFGKAFFTMGLSVCGMILSGYLLFHHYQIRYRENYKSVCNINEGLNCDAVALHPSSEFLGVPVAAWGILFYLVVILLVRLAEQHSGEKAAKRATSLLTVLLLAGFIIDMFLMWVSVSMIQSLCIFCMGTYVVNTLLLLLDLDFGRAWKKTILSTKDVMLELGWGA